MPRGGARPGAGRPVGSVSRYKTPGARFAALVLERNKEHELWDKILKTEDREILLSALKYLTDKRDGKAQQNVAMQGKVTGEINAVVFQGALPTWAPKNAIEILNNKVLELTAGSDPEEGEYVDEATA